MCPTVELPEAQPTDQNALNLIPNLVDNVIPMPLKIGLVRVIRRQIYSFFGVVVLLLIFRIFE